jgi:hypothetical protein
LQKAVKVFEVEVAIKDGQHNNDQSKEDAETRVNNVARAVPPEVVHVH